MSEINSKQETYYHFSLEEEREKLMEEYSDPEKIEEEKRKARRERAGRGFSAEDIEKARYILTVLGIGWETVENLKEEEEVKAGREKNREKIQEKIEDLENEVIKAAEEKLIPGEISELNDLFQLGKWKKFLENKIEKEGNLQKKEELQNKLTDLEKLSEEKPKIETGADEYRKGEALVEYRKEKKKFLVGLIGQYERSLVPKMAEIEELENYQGKLKDRGENLQIERLKNLKLTDRERYIAEQAGRIDLAYGDDPTKLMEKVREAADRGQDITRWNPRVWLNRYAVMAMTYPHLLTTPRFGMEASWNLKETFTQNPEFFAPGVSKEKEWFQLEEKGKKYSLYPTWQGIPGLIKMPVLSALEIDPKLHLENLYKNASLWDRAEVASVMRNCLLKKFKPEDIMGWDGGCFELKVKKKYKEKYQFDKKNGRLKDKITGDEYTYDSDRKIFLDKNKKELGKKLEEIIDTTSTFWLVTRYMEPHQVGGPEVVRSVYTSGKPETQKSLIADKNYFPKKETQDKIEKMDDYLSNKEKFTESEQTIIAYLKKLQKFETLSKEEKQTLERGIEEFFKRRDIDCSNWSFEKKLLMREILNALAEPKVTEQKARDELYRRAQAYLKLS